MKREIRFRGKRIDGSGWEYGSLVLGNNNAPATKDRCWINPSPEYGFEVIPETVGQFIGQQDKNRAEIFEDDVVMVDQPSEGPVKSNQEHLHGHRYVVEWDDDVVGWATFAENHFTGCEVCTWMGLSGKHVVIVGNRHDTPELLIEKEAA